MVISTGKKALALRLRKTTTLSIRDIADRCNSNKSVVGEWLKGVKSGQDGIGLDKRGQDGTGHQGQRTGLVRNVQDGQGKTVHISPGRTRHSGRTGQKSLSVGRGILLVFLIVGIFALFAWIYLTPEKKEESPEKVVKKTFGFEGKSIEDLDILDDLPQNQF